MIPSHIPDRITVSPQALRNSIEVDKAKLAQREKLLHWVKVKAAAERDFYRAAAPALGLAQSDSVDHNIVLERFLQAQKMFTEAQAEIEETVVLELRGRIKIQEAMLEEALKGPNKVVVPPGGVI